MEKTIIKTIDGNRYELTAAPVYVHVWGRGWFTFTSGESVKYINIDHVVSYTEIKA